MITSQQVTYRTTPSNIRGATGAFPAIEMEIEEFFKVANDGSTWKHYACRTFYIWMARGRKFLQNRTVVEFHISRWCG